MRSNGSPRAFGARVGAPFLRLPRSIEGTADAAHPNPTRPVQHPRLPHRPGARARSKARRAVASPRPRRGRAGARAFHRREGPRGFRRRAAHDPAPRPRPAHRLRGLRPGGLQQGLSLDSDGRGEIPLLRAGTYRLRADSQGYAPVDVAQVAVPAPVVSLTLTPGGTLEIQADRRPWPSPTRPPGPSTRTAPSTTLPLFAGRSHPLVEPDPSAREHRSGQLRLRGRGRSAQALRGPRGGSVVVSLP
jgi:hypothetical protein